MDKIRSFNNVESTAFIFAIENELIQCRMYFKEAYKLTPGHKVWLYAQGYAEKPDVVAPGCDKLKGTPYAYYEVVSHKDVGGGWSGLQEVIGDRRWNPELSFNRFSHKWFSACDLACMLQLQLFKHMPTEVLLIDVKR